MSSISPYSLASTASRILSRSMSVATYSIVRPVCRASIVAAEHENFCCLELREGGDATRLFFSRIAGEQATFVLREDHVKEAHGADAPRYDPLWAQLKYIR